MDGYHRRELPGLDLQKTMTGCSALQDIIQDKESIRSRFTHLETSYAKIAELQCEHRENNAKITKLQSRLETNKENINTYFIDDQEENILETIKAFDNEVAELTKTLTDLQKDNKKAEENFEVLNQKHEELIESAAKARHKKEEADKQKNKLDAIKKSIQEEQETFSEKQNQLEKKTELRNDLLGEKQSLEDGIPKLIEMIKATTERENCAMKGREELVKRLRTAEASLEEVTTHNKSKAKLLSELLTSKQDLEQSIEILASILDLNLVTQEKLTELEDEINNKRRILSQLTVEGKDLDEKLNIKQQELCTLQLQIGPSNIRCQENKGKIDELDERIKEKLAEIEEIKAKTAKAQTEKENRLENIMKGIRIEANNINSVYEEVVKLKKEFDTLVSEYNQKKELYGKIYTECNVLKRSVKCLYHEQKAAALKKAKLTPVVDKQVEQLSESQESDAYYNGVKVAKFDPKIFAKR